MIKILHSADWHLDAPMAGLSADQAAALQKESRALPGKIAALCKQEQCDLLLLAGDLFDSNPSRDTVACVQAALASLEIPVIITPGNHDFCSPDSPYIKETWPENVHIFKKAQIESIAFPKLDCRIYGAGYEGIDCPGLLKQFRAEGTEKYQIGVFHGDATTASSYFPITRHQLQESGLCYVALGHIHKQGSLSAGNTLCLWPGCPMGRGYDELGVKGVILTTLGEDVQPKFVPLDTPRFFDETLDVGADAAAALAGLLPVLDSEDFYRVTLTGYSDGMDLGALRQQFSQVHNLILKDETIPLTQLWKNVDSDSMEGLLFSKLKEAADSPVESLSEKARLAARICRSILDGQEVVLP
ncbi:MAG: DNA repair exonuclease [Oscillospiraceae bacterium]|nr:DNA repair exonuclease [Oscillospiraceae bacterium]